MLPSELNANKCSLLPNEPRLAVSLTVNINADGILDLSSIHYDLSVITNKARLTYKLADDIILSQPDTDGKYGTVLQGNENEDKLRDHLKTLHSIVKNRNAFRRQFEQFGVDQDDDDHHGGKESDMLV